MKAIVVNKDKSLSWTDVNDPAVCDDQVLIKVYAAALNRADLMQRAGDYPPPEGAPEWMGLEVAGEIARVGAVAAEKYGWKVGDKVCALLPGGGYTEYVAITAGMVMPVPKGLSFEEASALPEAFATAYVNLFLEGKMKAGETLLMNAGASGLASVIIPVAKSFGIRVITTVLTAEKAASIAHLGADIVVNTSEEDICQVLCEQEKAGKPIDVAIDCLGGDIMGKCLPYMNRGGRWIMIATLAGDVTQVDLKLMYKKNLYIIGNTLRARTPEEKTDILHNLVEKVWPKIESGEVRPTIYKVLPIQKAEEAQAILEHGENVGKVVLKVCD